MSSLSAHVVALSLFALCFGSCTSKEGGGGGGGGGDDSAPLHISIQDTRTNQGLDLEFEVQFDRAPTQDITLSYATSLVSAETPADVIPTSNSEFTIAAGAQGAVLRIPTYLTRRTDEPKQIAVDLQDSSNVIVERGHAIGTIDPRIQTIRRFADISVGAVNFGGRYACAITTEKRGVECWGGTLNSSVFENTGSLHPIPLTGLEAGVASIAVSGTSACAITSAGALRCWTANAPTPTVVPGLESGVTNVSLGPTHRCAVVRGGVKCWGSNLLWQLGDGTDNDSSTPVAVKNMTAGIKAVSVNGSISCALSDAGAVSCWGDPLWVPYVYPNIGIATNVGLTSGATAISVGEDYSCALKGDGTVVCWGRNVQRGDYNTAHHLVPMTALGNNNVAISARYGFNASWVCGKKADGLVQCTENNDPAQTVYPAGTRAFADEGDARCVITADGATRCTPGSPIQGTSLTTPTVPFDIAMKVAKLSGSCVVTTEGGVACLGNRGLVPVKGATSGVNQIAAVDRHACLLTATGGIKCWFTPPGALGTGTPKPVDVTGLGAAVTHIAVGAQHSCLLTQTGGVRCWGTNGQGQLGQGANVAGSTVPLAVPGLDTGVTALSLAGNRSCALVADGSVKCWGDIFGRNPIVISQLPAARALSVGPSRACVIANDGAVACWQEMPAQPSTVALGGPATSISVGNGHACATTENGLQCWGNNATGQLGNRSTAFAREPIPVRGITGATDVSAGPGITCVVTAPDGRLRCFGALSLPGAYSASTDLIEFL